MCQYIVTEYACGHDVCPNTKECDTKQNAGPFPQALPCEYTEVARHVREDCLACKAKGKEAREKARLVHHAATTRSDAPPSLIKKIWDGGERVLGEHRGTFIPLAAPTVVAYAPNVPKYAQTNTDGREIRIGPPKQANKRRQSGQRQRESKGKTTAILTPNDIPIIRELNEAGHRVKPQYSWITGDDLRWQEESSEVASPIVPTAPAAPVSHLDSLPSQTLHPLRQNPPEWIIQQQSSRQRLPHPQDNAKILDSSQRGQIRRKLATSTDAQQRLKRKPLPPRPVERYATELPASNISPTPKGSIRRQELPVLTSTYLAYHTKEDGQVRQATRDAILATDINRHSRTDEQSAELFFSGDYTAGQYDAHTLNALHGGHPSRGPKVVLRIPTVLRTGQQPALINPSEPAAERLSSPGSSNDGLARTPTVLRPGRPDSTYQTTTVGQIPAYYSTAIARVPAAASSADLKSSHRHAKLSTSQEGLWDAFVCVLPPTPEMKASEMAPHLPNLPVLPPLSMLGKPKSKEEIRMSARISRPGLHDFYTTGGNTNVKGTASEVPALAGMKVGVGAQQKQPGQVPRLRRQETRRFHPQTACAWDEFILQACASRETLSSK